MKHHNKINKNKQPSLTPKTVQTKAIALQDNRPASLLQRKVNNTGLPENLKSGIENLSGHSMNDVKVHYNSDKPVQLNALAYAQGTDIHVASGQEKHLPHEAWHVVQQKQGRVKPTLQMKGKMNVNVNDDKGLEKEADVMGAKATQLSFRPSPNTQLKLTTYNQSAPAQLMFETLKGIWNHFTGQGTTPVTPPTTVVTPPAITNKQAAEIERKRNLKIQKRNRLEAIWKKQGVIFHVHKPNANEDPDWIENFNAIRIKANNDNGFEFQTTKKAINIKYNFIQLVELFSGIGIHLFNMVPREFQGNQEESIMECFGTPHFMETYENKKQALLENSKKIVDDIDYNHVDSEFDKKPIFKKFDKKKPTEKINHLLGKDRFEGFAIGEEHNLPDSKEFLIKQMTNLKRNNVTTIYLEHLRSEYQSMIDEWYSNPAITPMPDKIKTFLKSNDFGNGLKGKMYNLQKLVQTAYDNKIRVVGIDSFHAQYEPDDKGGDELRDMTMNAFAQETIEGDKENRKGGKYVALVGQKHTNTHSARKAGGAGYSKGLPGLSQQLIIPAVKIDPKSKKIVLDKENKGNRISI